MLFLSAVAKQEKNKLSTGSTFVILLDIMLDPDVVVRICYNTEEVYWYGNEYMPFPFTIGDVTEETDSDPKVQLSVSNISQALQYEVESHDGANNIEVILRVVNTLNLDSSEPELEEYFVVTQTTITQDTITFSLGTEYSSRTRRPLNRYMKNNCPFKYKGLRCGATSKLEGCSHTLAACRERNNSKRFGGFQGIDQKGVYVNA